MMSTVCVIGLGYIGLPVSAILASRGFNVIGVDINQRAVTLINEGKAHFFEPDLQMLLSAAVTSGRLKAQTVPAEAEYYVIAVPTPLLPDKRPDLSYVEAATESIAPFLRKGACIILESTSPVGTTERMAAQLAELRPDLSLPTYKGSEEADLRLAHCPERILPGQMVRELTSNDRIIGGMTEACSQAAATLYQSFVTGDCLITDCRTAEFVKLAENSFRDVNIAFANEVSLICEELGIDGWKAIALANRHPRVNILRPGPGVGGHCIAVDPWFIVDSAPRTARLIRTAREVNEHKPHHIVERIARAAERFRNPVIACFGLTYKPDVEDMRESPALEIVAALAARDGIRVMVTDPNVGALPASLSGNPALSQVGIDDALEHADIVALLVGHRAFRKIERRRLLNHIVVDAIGLFAEAS